jgi:hypothetical protein
MNAHAPALHATLDVARRLDRAEIEFCALAGAYGSAAGVDRLEAGGGLALYGVPGSPLNKMLGLGLSGPVSDDDLDRIERFYREHRSPAQIELCPLAYADVPARLCARGFTVQGFESQLARVHGAAPQPPPGVRVTLAAPGESDLWIRVVAEGFGAAEPHAGGGPEQETFNVEQVMEMMAQFLHPELRRYIGWVDGQPAGGGSSWVLDGVLGIAGTSTLTPFRRRGVQAALAARAITDAPPGVELVCAATAPGSTSQRTFERLGFQLLYTRAIFVKA